MVYIFGHFHFSYFVKRKISGLFNWTPFILIRMSFMNWLKNLVIAAETLTKMVT